MTENSNDMQNNLNDKAEILMETLPFMRRYSNKVIVIKFGGHAMGKKEYVKTFAQDVSLLQQVGILPIVVHGGGPQIGEMLKKLKIESNFIDGLRVTDAATIDVVEMVLCGIINKSIVSAISNEGANAVGISGKDASLVICEKDNPELGYVGNPIHINTKLITTLVENDYIPVISPIGTNEEGETFNINADTMAGTIASALKADRLLLLTDVSGVKDKSDNKIEKASTEEIKKLIKENVIKDGMIPKVNTAIDSIEKGVRAVVILDGSIQNACLLELFTDHGVGTLIRKELN